MKPLFNRGVLFFALVLLFACESRHQAYYQEVENSLAESSTNMTYKPKALEFTDTLYVYQVRDSLKPLIEQIRTELHHIPEFQAENLTLEQIAQWRNQELELRGLPNFYNRVFSGECDLPWCKEFKIQLQQTDSLITRYDQLDLQSWVLWRNIAWYVHRKYYFYVKREEAAQWEHIISQLDQAIKYEKGLRLFSTMANEDIALLKAWHEYTLSDAAGAQSKRQESVWFFADKRVYAFQ